MGAFMPEGARAYRAIIARDLRLAFSGGGATARSLVFFTLCTVIFALGLGPDPTKIAPAAIAILWTTTLLAVFLSLDGLFQSEAEDGSLDVLAQRFDFLPPFVLAKAVTHWLTTGFPMLVLTPLLGVILALPSEAIAPLMISFAIGSPALSLTGALVASLTFPIKRSGVLMTLLAGPLFTPTLLFGVEAATAGAVGDPRFAPSLLFLGATSLMALIIAPLAGAAALRLNIV